MKKTTSYVNKPYMWLLLLLLPVLLLSLMMGCAEEPAEPEETPSTETPNESVDPPADTVKQPDEAPNAEEFRYTTYPYVVSESEDWELEITGRNIAKGKKATASSTYSSGNAASCVTNGSIADIWASSADEKNPWVQIDLGEPTYIGSVEVVHRQDGDMPGQRSFFQIQLSNDESFETYEVIGTLGSIPFAYGSSYVVNCTLDVEFQYVRLQRTEDAGHIALAEIRVYDEMQELEEPRKVQNAPAEAVQIVSKTTGKVLSVSEKQPAVEEYTFRNAQRWLMETNEDGYVLLKNADTGKYLACTDYTLSFVKDSKDESALWVKRDMGTGWFRISSKNGGVLTINKSELAVCTQILDTEQEKWDISTAYTETLAHSDASWLQDGYGVMYHLLVNDSNRAIVDQNVDVEAICDQLVDVGAEYFVLTIGQGSGQFIAPCAKYASIVGASASSRATQRDLIMEFALALKDRGIKLIAYTTALPSTAILQDLKAFTTSDDYENTRQSAMLWSLVLREWSVQYGDLISGWWMDGVYNYNNPYEDIRSMYVNALKAGNPDAIVALNPGIYITKNGELTDYTAGETDYPFGSDDPSLITDPANWLTPENKPVSDDVQWFMLTYLSVGWCQNTGPRAALYDASLWGEFAKTVLSQGGGVCFDVKFNAQGGSNYTMEKEMYDILKAIQAACGK